MNFQNYFRTACWSEDRGLKAAANPAASGASAHSP